MSLDDITKTEMILNDITGTEISFESRVPSISWCRQPSRGGGSLSTEC